MPESTAYIDIHAEAATAALYKTLLTSLYPRASYIRTRVVVGT